MRLFVYLENDYKTSAKKFFDRCDLYNLRIFKKKQESYIIQMRSCHILNSDVTREIGVSRMCTT